MAALRGETFSYERGTLATHAMHSERECRNHRGVPLLRGREGGARRTLHISTPSAARSRQGGVIRKLVTSYISWELITPVIRRITFRADITPQLITPP